MGSNLYPKDSAKASTITDSILSIDNYLSSINRFLIIPYEY
jgi:hypothetical protein